MGEIKFRVWSRKESTLYYRGYQKLTHILLCENDQGSNAGRGTPVKRGSYDECDLLQSTSLLDKNGVEVFEGDLLRISSSAGVFEAPLKEIPDMYKSRKLHPLHEILAPKGISDEDESIEFEVIGNIFNAPIK